METLADMAISVDCLEEEVRIWKDKAQLFSSYWGPVG